MTPKNFTNLDDWEYNPETRLFINKWDKTLTVEDNFLITAPRLFPWFERKNSKEVNSWLNAMAKHLGIKK